MLRISGISMPLSYTENDLRQRVLALLGVSPDALHTCVMAKRSVDARKKHAVHFQLTVDVQVADEAAVLRRARGRRESIMPVKAKE